MLDYTKPNPKEILLMYLDKLPEVKSKLSSKLLKQINEEDFNLELVSKIKFPEYTGLNDINFWKNLG